MGARSFFLAAASPLAPGAAGAPSFLGPPGAAALPLPFLRPFFFGPSLPGSPADDTPLVAPDEGGPDCMCGSRGKPGSGPPGSPRAAAAGAPPSPFVPGASSPDPSGRGPSAPPRSACARSLAARASAASSSRRRCSSCAALSVGCISPGACQ